MGIYYSNNKILYIVGIIIAIGYSYLINRTLVKKVIHKLLKK